MSQDLRANGAKVPDFLDGVSLGSLWRGAENSGIRERSLLCLSGPEWAGNQGWGEGLVGESGESAGPLVLAPSVRLTLEGKGEDAFVEDADLLLPPLLTVGSTHVQRHTQLL